LDIISELLDFQRGKLVLQNDESTETNYEQAREMEDYYESLSNRQVIALPTPLTTLSAGRGKTTPSIDFSIL